MSMSDLAQLLEAHIPSLHRYALRLTRRHHEANDLVQDCLARALENQHLFTPGTNLGSWLITLMHNLYVTDVRRAVGRGVSVNVDEVAWRLEATADPTASPSSRRTRRYGPHNPSSVDASKTSRK